ncbi:uncharacterized protein LOC124251906 [Equus quagga]|uniref:uncharacterized protein LOC124251906 n=1 Tax=Equus quagga TaxID=89248 RepID=UPI001EE1FEF7|nr:uncharacterized protein LOC124251906 [Equus quagga]
MGTRLAPGAFSLRSHRSCWRFGHREPPGAAWGSRVSLALAPPPASSPRRPRPPRLTRGVRGGSGSTAFTPAEEAPAAPWSPAPLPLPLARLLAARSLPLANFRVLRSTRNRGDPQQVFPVQRERTTGSEYPRGRVEGREDVAQGIPARIPRWGNRPEPKSHHLPRDLTKLQQQKRRGEGRRKGVGKGYDLRRKVWSYNCLFSPYSHRGRELRGNGGAACSDFEANTWEGACDFVSGRGAPRRPRVIAASLRRPRRSSQQWRKQGRRRLGKKWSRNGKIQTHPLQMVSRCKLRCFRAFPRARPLPPARAPPRTHSLAHTHSRTHARTHALPGEGRAAASTACNRHTINNNRFLRSGLAFRSPASASGGGRGAGSAGLGALPSPPPGLLPGPPLRLTHPQGPPAPPERKPPPPLPGPLGCWRAPPPPPGLPEQINK